MNGRITGSLALAAFVLSVGASALAQDTPAAASSAAPAPAAAPPADTGQPPAAGSAAPASSAPKTDRVVTGYAYKQHGAPSVMEGTGGGHHYARMVRHANEAVAKVSGFEMLADGGSRLYVQLSRQVDVEQSKEATGASPSRGAKTRKTKRAPQSQQAAAAGPPPTTRLTFLMKGTELARRNDENALETMHFNTPVVRARMLPSGRDVRFVVELRADVTPTMKVVPTKDSGAMLQIDFAQGSYVQMSMAPPGAGGANEPVNGALPSQPAAPSDTNSSGETNDSMGPQ